MSENRSPLALQLKLHRNFLTLPVLAVLLKNVRLFFSEKSKLYIFYLKIKLISFFRIFYDCIFWRK